MTNSRTLIRHLATMAATVALSCAALPLMAADDAQAFDDAMQLYHDNRWAAAYGRLASLADRGHAESARIALLMLRYGPRLYGSQWSATEPQVARWSRLAQLPQQLLVAEGGD